MEVITQDTIIKTREWFHNNCMECIQEVLSGKVRVNDQDDYIASRTSDSLKYLQGEYDRNFSFMQRAHFIQTGECVALLP